ncbi:MAG: phytanoyl-CoA dioxygenase family protein [Planctomycetota bacterium]
MSTLLAPERTDVALSAAEKTHFDADGFHVARALFGPAETGRLIERFMAIHAEQLAQRTPEEVAAAGNDPLKLYPRIMHPHRFDELSRGTMLDPRVISVLRQLLHEEPLAVQSMFYFKPAGARGQALHQDNFYLQAAPSTCIAAWIALERCDVENGGLMVVPNTHRYAVQCPAEANAAVSFTKEFVAPPKGCKPEMLILEPGDVLFFNGNVIHGSGPNKSKDRFRRSFICHYVGESAEEISQYYHPLLNAAGREVARRKADRGGPCGVEISGPH